ncbi:MAG: polysaccharide biosynthesis tyrosine autokinase [Desulfobacteraceae bacterium]|nr:polysaccharide biosynthesis tyrosine autokinase [Desulfobacteraceae bacterium]
MEEREIHLRDYLQVVKRRKSTVITFFAVTVLVTVIATYTSISRPMYQASTRAVIEKNVSYSLTGHRYEGYTGYDPTFLQTQTQIIKSQGVAEKVMEKIGADRMFEVYFPEGQKEEPSLAQAVKGWVSGAYSSFKKIIGIDALLSGKDETDFSGAGQEGDGQAGAPPTRAEIMESIVRQGITVAPAEETRVVTISYTCPNPVLAQKIANSVAEAYIDQLLDMRMQMSNYSIDWMKKKAEQQRKKLEESEQALHEYKKKHNIVTIEDRLAILPDRLGEISEKLTRAQTRRRELEAVYNQVKGKSPRELESLPAITKEDSVSSINKEILEAEQNLSELSKKYGEKHPKMIAARNELSRLKEVKKREVRNAVESIKNEYLLAKSQEEKFKEMLEQTKFDAARLNEKSIQLDILKRRVDTNKYLYDALIKRMEEKGLTEKAQLVNVWVIEEAKMPQMPVPQGKKRNVLLGLILGIFGGVGLAFFFEYLDNTAKSPEDIEDRFDVPVIGIIDRFKDRKTSIVDNVLEHESSNISENFKNLRTSILLSAADSPPKVLLVTSMGAKEGKSTVASCLAISMARTGLRVLLIDGDMRRPQINEYFHIDKGSGLSAYLAGNVTENLLNRDALPNLDIMASGPVPPNPSELLSSDKLGILLKKSRQKYDVIILDSPPLGVADPMILSRSADGVILLAMAGETRYEVLDKGIKKLRDVSAKISGIVLNRFDVKKSGYYYNYSDYYYSSDSG